MENPYAPPGTSDQSEAGVAVEVPKPTLPAASSGGLLVLACCFALSAFLSLLHGWIMSTPIYVDSVPEHTLGTIVWAFAKLTRFGFGVGFLMCWFVPAKSHATQWAVGTALLHYLGLTAGSDTFDTMVITIASFYGAPVLFWICMYRLAKWSEFANLQLYLARLFWVGTASLLVGLAASGMFLLVETPSEAHLAEKWFGAVTGVCTAIAWSYYSWVTWQFHRHLR